MTRPEVMTVAGYTPGSHGCWVAFVLLLVTVVTTRLAIAQTEPWRADLDALVEHVRSTHANPYHTASQAAFDSAVRALEDNIDALEPHAIVLAMAQLLAMVGDGHTRLTLPVDPHNLGFRQGHADDPEPASGVPRFRTLPTRFGAFQEGIHVTSVTDRYSHLLGSRLESIADVPADEILERMRPYVSYDSESAFRRVALTRMAIPEVLVDAGVTSDVDETRAVFTDREGRRLTVPLESVAYGVRPDWVDAQTAAGAVVPLALRESEAWYWLEHLPPDNALYVQIDRLQDAPDETLGLFMARVSAALRQADPERVILDLRRNHGGDNTFVRSVVLALARWEGGSTTGRLFALIGPETFSAGVTLAAGLEEWTQVVFVGEPLGSPPTHYGSSDRKILPNSRLVSRVSQSFHQGWTGSPARAGVDIEVPLVPSIRAYLQGEDEALEHALSFEPAPTLAGQLVKAYESGGINAALINWIHYRTDPRTAQRSTEAAMNALGWHLLEEGEARFAAAIFLFNRENYPNSVEAYRGEALSLIAQDDTAAATATLESGLRAVPGDPRLESLLMNLRRER